MTLMNTKATIFIVIVWNSTVYGQTVDETEKYTRFQRDFYSQTDSEHKMTNSSYTINVASCVTTAKCTQ